MSADLILVLNLDQPTLAYRRVRSINERLIAAMDALTGGATYTIEIRPIAAGAVATDHTATGNFPRLVLKVKGPVGDIELARLDTTDFTALPQENSENVGWSASLPLTTAELRAFFADGAQQKFATLEITNVFANGTLKPLYLASTQILAGYLTDDTAATTSSMYTAILKAEGALVLDQLFGQLRLPAGEIRRAQLVLEDVPTGGPVTVSLVKPDGTAYGITVTVADGETFGETVPGTPVSFIDLSEFRAKPTVVGLTNPGGFGTLTLFIQST